MKAMMTMTEKSFCQMERKERKHDADVHDLEYIQPSEMFKKKRQGNCSLSGGCSVVQDSRRRREDRRRKTWKRRRRR